MRWEGSDSCPALKDWPGGLGEESSHVEGFAVADSRGEGSSGAGGSVPDGIPSLEPDGAPVVPGSGLNLFGDYVGDWLQEPHDTVEDSHSPYVPVTLEMPEAEIVDDAEEDVRVFEGREAQAFQRAVFEQGMSRRRAAQAATGNWHIRRDLWGRQRISGCRCLPNLWWRLVLREVAWMRGWMKLVYPPNCQPLPSMSGPCAIRTTPRCRTSHG